VGERGGAPEALVTAVAKAFDGLGPFAAPEAHDLVAVGLGPRQLAAAVRLDLVTQLAPQVILKPDISGPARAVLSTLNQPFTLSEARAALNTTRRVAVPLLELLDRTGITVRQSDDRRTVT
jgi:selenocysteine-specific elongation factor